MSVNTGFNYLNLHGFQSRICLEYTWDDAESKFELFNFHDIENFCESINKLFFYTDER